MIKYIILALTVLAISIICLSYKQVQNSQVISVLVDITEGKDPRPQSQDVIPLLKFNEDSWSGVYFRFTEITDVGLTPIKKLSIGYENPWLSNELERKKKIEKFQLGIDSFFILTMNDTTGKSNSSIYIPIVKELEVLAHYPFKSRSLIIYSDLMENSQIISLYDPSSFKRLLNDPDSIEMLFESKVAIPDLKGIKVIFVYQPQTVQSDERYRAISGLYKKMLEEHGAEVEIAAVL